MNKLINTMKRRSRSRFQGGVGGGNQPERGGEEGSLDECKSKAENLLINLPLQAAAASLTTSPLPPDFYPLLLLLLPFVLPLSLSMDAMLSGAISLFLRILASRASLSLSLRHRQHLVPWGQITSFHSANQRLHFFINDEFTLISSHSASMEIQFNMKWVH